MQEAITNNIAHTEEVFMHNPHLLCQSRPCGIISGGFLSPVSSTLAVRRSGDRRLPRTGLDNGQVSIQSQRISLSNCHCSRTSQPDRRTHRLHRWFRNADGNPVYNRGTRYKAVSLAVREIFSRHTDLIEPLSLDEAYLDVTANQMGLATATRVACTIRAQIWDELSLTASAGVAPNKFLAKIASEWKKPNGLFVIQPHEVVEFLRALPIGRVPGVGKVTEKHLNSAGIKTIGDVQALELVQLEGRFGRYGQRLYELARGIDHSPVVPNRVSKSVSAEDTFPTDLPLPELQPAIHRLAEKVWNASRANARQARTIVLKLKTREFATLTRSLTPTEMPKSANELAELAVSLFDRVDLGTSQLFRLAGVGLSNFQIEAELPLLASNQATESIAEKFTPNRRVDAVLFKGILGQ